MTATSSLFNNKSSQSQSISGSKSTTFRKYNPSGGGVNRSSTTVFNATSEQPAYIGENGGFSNNRVIIFKIEKNKYTYI